MDLDFTREQKLLADSAAEFLVKECPYAYVKELEESEQDYSPKLWKKIADPSPKY